ncbi:ABC transporter substrate-binding protein [Mesorhizobium retamae]|uniref:ABC transporter substrate-binding protein n=1 Tax=Mesorhizobium retamae TaxID=2912854 RepID=A0ABS9QD94_9HYPH|nr:ABC transporter substrate-binding protein [Mesorhizobium sp. IRAMC:0171]MCG7505390.1 ABC transporter substrate-binding protein [Mesorhizobium sp. IRAMC:0171]
MKKDTIKSLGFGQFAGQQSIDRRTLLKVSASIAAGATAGLLLPSGHALAEEPKRGGKIRVATNDASPADQLDPARLNTFTDGLRTYFVYEKLTEIDANGKHVPQLATSWGSDKSASTWTFELRPGVTFHNGKKLTAADVVHTYKRILDKATASLGRSYITDVKAVRADGDSHVVFELEAPNAEFPIRTALRWMGIVFEGAADFPKDTIGTGPWKLQDFQPGIVASYKRNENYWRSGLPYIDEIESIGIGDEAARLNALISGEVDVIQAVNSKAVARINGTGTAKALVASGGPMATFSMRADTAPFTNNDIRTALKHAFDRKRFLDLAFDGVGVIGMDHPVPPSDPFFNKDLPMPKADPDMVKSLLAKAGAANTEFELHTSDANYGGSNAAVVLGELMKSNGAKVRVTRHPADSYWTAVYMQAAWSASSWTVRPTALAWIEAGWIKGAAYNEGFWSDPRVDQLVRQAKQELDETKRRKMVYDAQEIIAKDGSSIIPIFVPWIDGVNNRVQNLKAHPLLFCGAGQWAEVWLNA